MSLQVARDAKTLRGKCGAPAVEGNLCALNWGKGGQNGGGDIFKILHVCMLA